MVAILSSVGNVGIDVFVHHLINASGGKGTNLTIQKLGRGLRRAHDKEILDYHDFLFSYKVHPILTNHSYARLDTIKQEGHKVVFENEIIPYMPNSKETDDEYID